MRTSTVLVLLGCIIASSFASYAVKHTPTFKFDAKALNVEGADKKASFGDLLTLFQTHDFQDNSAIHDFLDKLRARVQEERSEHHEIYTTQKTACTQELEFRDAEIQAGKDSYAASQAHLGTCTNERAEAVSLRDRAEAAILVYGTQLKNLRDDRNEQIRIYQERTQKLSKTSEAISKAIEYVDELETTASNYGLGQTAEFIQIANTLLAVSVQTKQTNKVLPVYNKLLQVHKQNRFNIGDVQELRELFEQIGSNVDQAQRDLDEQEGRDLQTFNQRERDILDILARLEEQVALSETYILRMDDCITQEGSISAMADDKVVRNTQLKEKAEQLCQDNEDEWTEGEKARNHQLHLLSQLQWALDQLSEKYHADLLSGADNINEIINAAA